MLSDNVTAYRTRIFPVQNEIPYYLRSVCKRHTKTIVPCEFAVLCIDPSEGYWVDKMKEKPAVADLTKYVASTFIDKMSGEQQDYLGQITAIISGGESFDVTNSKFDQLEIDVKSNLSDDEQ